MVPSTGDTLLHYFSRTSLTFWHLDTLIVAHAQWTLSRQFQRPYFYVWFSTLHKNVEKEILLE